jgi:hypothetical protein
MDISEMTTKQLKILLKSFSNVSLGVSDLILKNMIEDELERRGS